jgi:hypothetical protein
MDAQPSRPALPHEPSRRLFLHEPGWAVGLKVGSERVFCYMMAPGQDYYHRLLDGEVYLFHGDERLCLACAERRGLLSSEPKVLRRSAPETGPDAAEGPVVGDDGGEFELG